MLFNTSANGDFQLFCPYLCRHKIKKTSSKHKFGKVEIKDLIKLTHSKVVAGNPESTEMITKAFSSDLMSDVLTLDEHNIVLITGLANVQLLRTAEMADVPVVLLGRNKPASPEMIALAENLGILLLESPFSIFRLSGLLYSHGIKPLY
jgi:hypothetical protein